MVKSEEDAVQRARNEAAPINSQRFGLETPCVKTEAVLTARVQTASAVRSWSQDSAESEAV